MSQGSKLIGKMFGKEKREQSILNDLRRAGQNKAELETGNSLTTTSLSSSDENVHQSMTGVSQSKAGTSTHNISSSKGQVVSQPPDIQRQPLDHTYGGNYANGKNPTELSTYNTTPADEKGLIDNTNPRYDNDADMVKKQGQFFDPKDTQGRLYESGSGGKLNDSSTDERTPVGVQAARASYDLPGGVAKGEYGEDTEATNEKLMQRNLKTKPAAYAEEEKREKQLESVETDSYNAGRRKGLEEAKKGHGYTQENHGSSLSKTVDRKAEHKKNKSAYNEGGLAGATKEAKYGQDQSSLEALQDDHESSLGGDSSEGHGTGISSKYVGAGTGATTEIDTRLTPTKHQSGSQTLDPAVNHPALTGQAGDHSTKPVSVAANQSGRKSHNPSGYDQEIKRLDNSIAKTQKEIEELGGASDTIPGTGTTKAVTNKSDESSNPGLFGGSAGAISASSDAAASALNFGRSNDETLHRDSEGGYLDSTKAAIASAGVAAASAFGYEGYNRYYVDENHANDVMNEHKSTENIGSAGSAATSTEKPGLYQEDDAQNKPSATTSGAQHPGATATSGEAALAKDRTSQGTSLSNKAHHSSSGSGIASSVAGAVAGAASAAGLSGSGSKGNKVDSLVEEVAGYDDVKNEPCHETKGGVLEEKDTKNNSSLPDDLDPSKAKDSQAETSGVDNSRLEADIAAYNKEHGFTQGKSLVAAAEDKFPEVKEQPIHHREAEEDVGSLSLRSLLVQLTGKSNAIAGVASNATGEAQDVSRNTANNRKDTEKEAIAAGNAKDAVDPLAGDAPVKSRKESTGFESGLSHSGSARRGSHAPPVADAAMGKTREESMEIENAAFAARTGSVGKLSHSQPVSGAVTGKSRQESLEIEHAAQLAGANRGSSTGHPLSGAAAGKPNAESREIEEAAYQAGHHHGSCQGGSQHHGSTVTAGTRTGKGIQNAEGRPMIEVIGIAERDEAQRVAQQTTRELLDNGEDLSGSKIVIDANKNEVYRAKNGGPTTGASASGSHHNSAGHDHPDASFKDSQKEVDGSNNHTGHEKVKDTLEHRAEKGQLGNVPGSTNHSHLASSDDTGDRKHSYTHRNELTDKDVSYTEVNVLGEPDTKRAQMLAQDAIACLKGRKDILAAKELSVDAYTGSICDQDGRFVAQLCQRRLSQVDLGQRRRSSGGLVSLGSNALSHTSPTSGTKKFPVAHGRVSESLGESSKGPFRNEYNLPSAQGSN